MTTDIVRVPLDVDAIAARAQAAPGGYWVAFTDSIWIPWHADTDAVPCSPHDHGRYIAVQDGDWHGDEDPPAELWAFLAAARDDVLTLAAEVRRLNSTPTATTPETPEHLAQRIYEAACSAPGASYEIMTQPAWENLDPVHRACWLAAAVEARHDLPGYPRPVRRWLPARVLAFARARRALDENAISEYKAVVEEDTPEFLRLNRAVADAENGVPAWVRTAVEWVITWRLHYWDHVRPVPFTLTPKALECLGVGPAPLADDGQDGAA